MNPFVTPVAVAVGKAAALLSRGLGRGGGTALPGLLALRLAPELLRELAAQLPKGCVLITGTNGKTTTAKMIAAIIRAGGLEPLHNRTGSNLLRGLTATLLERSTLWGSLAVSDKALGIFEVDEAVFPQAIAAVSPRVVVITNLFRDQLDRYGELDSVAQLWREGLAHLPPTVSVVLNADDPLVAGLAENVPGQVHFFGIEDADQGLSTLGLMADARFCRRCGQECSYRVVFYGHLGHYRCEGCGAGRPTVAFAAQRISLAGLEGLRADLQTPQGALSLQLPLPGLYNLYNALAAVTTGLALGIPLTVMSRALQDFTAVFGRTEQVVFRGRRLYLVLVKNPVGFSEALRTLCADGSPKNFLFILNDQTADGRDVSWIWDVDLSPLVGSCRHVVLSGRRAEDMALRLKYAGVSPQGDTASQTPPALVVRRDLRQALEEALAATPPDQGLYVLPTYTAMLEFRELLSRLGGARHYWQEAA